jgi:hypothetical protein
MINEEHSIILQHLSAIRGELADLRSGQNRVLDRLTTMVAHMADFYSTDISHNAELRDLYRRVDRIEARLELRDQ